MDSSVDRLPQYSGKCKDKDVKDSLRGSSWLRVHEEGSELVWRMLEGEMPGLCLTKRVR